MPFRGLRILITTAFLALIPAAAAAVSSAQEPQPGAAAVLRPAQGKPDAFILPNFAFFAEPGEPPSPYLPEGRWELEMTGLVSVNRRGIYSLEAEVNGVLSVKVNGREVLRSQESTRSKRFRLESGTNLFLLNFTPPSSGPARLRLHWVPRNSTPNPIPPGRISHLPSPLLEKGANLRRARALVAELRCLRCHQADAAAGDDLRMDAPSFESIGARLRSDWMAEWIANPKALRPSAAMPRLFRGPEAKAQAEAAAAYLASLRAGPPRPPSDADPEEGGALFEKLRCGTCHQPPGAKSSTASLLPLTHVTRKFQPGALEAYLLHPRQHFEWGRMPDFKLTQPEAAALAAFLQTSPPPEPSPAPAPPELLAQGKHLIQTSGCLNCHSLSLENHHRAKPLHQLASSSATGCLAPPGQAGPAPDFALSKTGRAALADFLKHRLPTLARRSLRDFALRETRRLNCAGCHAKGKPFTAFELLGEKLKPEWAAAFIAGEIQYKPRPWLEARMPAFPARAKALARGLSILHGFPPSTPPEPPADPDLARLGEQLLGPDGGFSCTACHATAPGQDHASFESPGVNFAYTSERLRPGFFHRWVLNPLAIDPATKMPAFFGEDGRSPIFNVLEGDAHRQIDALWHHLRLLSERPQP